MYQKTKSLLAIVFFFMSTSLFAQDFASIGSKWYYSESGNGACSGNCDYRLLESVSDTIINGKTTHKVTNTYFAHTGDTMYNHPMYFYQSSDTVYMWSENQSKFLITFIFNGSIGDTLTLNAPDYDLTPSDSTYRLLIDTIINETIDGVTVKKYKALPLDIHQFYFGDYFSDRIGGLGWILPQSFVLPESTGPIRCYSDTQIDTSFQSVACDFVLYTSIATFSDDSSIKVFPNPTDGWVEIKALEDIRFVDVNNLSGVLIKRTEASNIDFSDVPNGQYIMNIHLKSGKIISQKIIKERL